MDDFSSIVERRIEIPSRVEVQSYFRTNFSQRIIIRSVTDGRAMRIE